MSELLKTEHLSVSFFTDAGEVEAVRDVSFTVEKGEVLAIVGESGCGKSALCKSIMKLPPKTAKIKSGKILVNGVDITDYTEKNMSRLRGELFSMVFQDPMTSLNPTITVGKQIGEAVRIHNKKMSRGQIRKRVIELMQLVEIDRPEERIRQYPHEFSGGMRQRAVMAIALAGNPKILFGDEPTTALDVTVQRQILDHLESLTGELGTAVLLITHDLGLAAERASHLVVMYKGQVVESGPALEILRDPRHEYTKRLVGAAPSLASRRLGSPETDLEVKVAADSTVAQELQDVGADGVREVIVARNLVKDFKIRGRIPFRSTAFRAVDDVSFTLRRGTTTAIVGESGSGKSTVARMLLGLEQPTSGSVDFDGAAVAGMNSARNKEFRRRVQPIFQNPYGSLDPMYSVFRLIAEPLKIHGIGDNASRTQRVRELLDLVALPRTIMERFPSELSGGQRQRVAIARALALNPEVVVCDEAVSALDVLVQAQILGLLSALQQEFGLSYVFITHDLAVVRQIADDVLVMRKGKVVDAGPTDDIFTAPTSDYTRNLLDSIPGGSIDFARS